MSETSQEQAAQSLQPTTAELLTMFRKELAAGGFREDVTDQLVRDALAHLLRGDEFTVSMRYAR